MIDELKRVLDYLEERIDPIDIKRREENHIKALSFQPLAAPVAQVGYPVRNFKRFAMEEIHSDVEKMAYNELVGVLPVVEMENGGVPMIRANYGVGILPAAFGLKCRIVAGNMPWVDAVGQEGVRAILSRGVPDFTDEMSVKVLDTYAFYNEMLKGYPKCREAIKIYQPDYQGPFDAAELIYGTDILLDLYDEPELVTELLELVTKTYEVGLRKIMPYLNDKIGDCIGQWQFVFPGNILLRDDSAVNLSPTMYEEFVRPYDDRLLEAFECGSMHFCGRADQWVFKMAESDGILGYNFGHMDKLQFGQPYLDFLKPSFFDKRKPIISYTLKPHELEGFDFTKYRTGVTYSVPTGSREEAENIYKKYFKAK